ncbi:MAG: DCC1-like thiol-disulfide oxidoreductase family protein [Pseudomonadota bacterium]
MDSLWTWRQYAVFRVLFGVYLLVHFTHLLPWATELFSSAGMLQIAEHSPFIGVFPNLLGWFDSPIVVVGLLGSSVISALALIAGKFDRLAAVWMWFVLACLFGRNPLIANPSLPVVGWMLLFHALLPRRREAWQPHSPGTAALPRMYVIAAWFLLAVAYSYSGWTKLFSDAWVQGETVRWVLENPLARDTWLRVVLLETPAWLLQGVTLGIFVLELLFAPLALSARLRPWIWLGMLAVQFGFLALLNFSDLTTPMLLLHLLTFDPRWLPTRAAAKGATIYYDGDCGLCHSSIRFVLAEDRQSLFRFAPLQGDAGRQDIPELAEAQDFDSFIVVTPDGQRLEKFVAARYVLDSLGGLWRAVAWLMQLVPQRVGDSGYSLVARNRRRLFSKPDGLCPIMPREFALRFNG